MNEIIERIKKRLTEKGMNAKELSIASGIAYSTLSDILKGKTKELSVQKAKAIAEVLDMTLDFLIDGKEYEPDAIAAHFDGDEFTEEELKAIEDFKEFVKSKRFKE